MIKIITLFFVLAGMMYSQGLTGHYSSILKKRAVAGVDYMYTTNLEVWWFDSTLTNGSVTTWDDVIASYDMTTWFGDTTYRPIKTNDGVVFDGTDWMYDDAIASFEAPMSFFIVVKQVDSTSAVVLGGISSTHRISLSRLAGHFGIRTYDGTDTRSTNYYETVGYGDYQIYIATWDGSTTQKLYANGVEQTSYGTNAVYQMASGYMAIGNNGQGNQIVPAGTIIRSGGIFSIELNQSQVTQITNYFIDYYGLE